MRNSGRFLAIFLTCVVLSLSARAQGSITVFAAASLTNALQNIDAAYTKRSGIAIRHSFAASSTLARQIEAGAPAQVFLSADTKWMDYLDQKNLIDRTSRREVLGNELVLVAPRASALGPRAIDSRLNWNSLLGNGRLAIGDPDHVPAGIYAKEALQNLGAWAVVAAHLARAEDVRGALAFVERGDAPLGIVYLTDARETSKVSIVGVFPSTSHAPIVYPFAIVREETSPAVQAYYRYLTGPEGLAVFRQFGFSAR